MPHPPPPSRPLPAAFISLLKSLNVTAADLLSDKFTEVLGKVLGTHVVPGVAAKSSDLKNGQQLDTLNAGQKLTVRLGAAGRVGPAARGGPARRAAAECLRESARGFAPALPLARGWGLL